MKLTTGFGYTSGVGSKYFLKNIGDYMGRDIPSTYGKPQSNFPVDMLYCLFH